MSVSGCGDVSVWAVAGQSSIANGLMTVLMACGFGF
jgi:hypothetical protein